MTQGSHLCAACRRVMCRECKAIAVEYSTKMEDERNKARQELKIAQRSIADLEHILKLGVGPQILAWMDSLTPAQLRAAVEKAADTTTPHAGA